MANTHDWFHDLKRDDTTMITITIPKIDMTILVGSSCTNVGQMGRLIIDGIWPNKFIIIKKRNRIFFVEESWVLMFQGIQLVLDYLLP